MKRKKGNILIQFIRCCPLITMLFLSVLILTGIGLVGMMKKDASYYLSMEHPLFLSVLLKEQTASVDKQMSNGQSGRDESVVSGDGMVSGDGVISGDGIASGDGVDIPQAALATASGDASGNAVQVWQTNFETVPMRKAKSPYYEDNNRIALTTDAPYIVVDDTYYEDALFIGDSRVEGLKDYGNIKGADFFCEKGLSVYDLMEVKISVSGQKKRTLKKMLAAKQYKRIYIMLGVNELGKGYASDFQSEYQKDVEQILALQPEADLFLMGMMHMTNAYAKGQTVFNNDNIDMRNTLVAELANGTNILYLDMNVAVSGKKGGLKREYTWDGVHLKAEYYKLWVDFLNEHGYGVEQ